MSQIFLASACLIAGAAQAQDVLSVGSTTGAQVFFNNSLTRTFNFGVTSSGGSAGITISEIDVILKRENAVTANVVLSIYSGFGGAAGGGSVLGAYSTAASNFNNQFNSFAVSLGTPLTLGQGAYSLVLTTTDTNNYFFKAGQLSLKDSLGNPLTSSFWVPDSRTDGSATTSLSAATPVLAEHTLGTQSVNFGKFRVGATLSQAVSLTNTAFATSNNMTQELAISSTSTSGATVSTNGLISLAQGSSSNLTVGMSSATAGVRSGSVTVNFNSVQGASAATGTTAIGNRVINLSGTGYRTATSSFDRTSVNLGNRRITETNVTDTVAVSNTATADGYSEKLKLALVSTSGATAGSMPASIAAGGSSNVAVGLATIGIGANSGTVTLSRTSDGTGTSDLADLSLGSNQAITVTATGYRAAAAGFSATSLDLGKFHVGATGVTGTTTVSNTASGADVYSEKLRLANSGTTGVATVGSMPALIAAGGSSNLTVGLSGISAAGANSGTVTLGLVSDGTGTSGLADLGLGSQVINVTATGYTGQSTWNVDGSGVWNSFDGWDTTGGKPGVDGSLSTNDTATFGSAATTARTITLGAAVPTLRSLTFNNGNAAYYIAAGGAGRIQLGTSAGNGALDVLAGNHTVSAGLELAQATTANVATGSRLLLSGALDGTGALNKTGAGKLEIDGTGALTGATTVSAGLLTVNGSIAGSSVTVANGGSLGGSGTVGSTVVQSGGTLTPGNSPGDLDVTGNLTWSSGGDYNWQLLNAAGVAGTGWDVVTITGDLILSGLSAENRFDINLWTLQSISPDVNGDALNFDNTQSYTWTIARVGGAIVGFQQSYFNLNLLAANGAGGFSNNLGGGSISIQKNGQNLDLVFTAFVQPVPEPSTYGLMIGGAALALAALRRRRRS